MLNANPYVNHFETLQNISYIAAQIVDSGMATEPCIIFEFDPGDDRLWLECFENALVYHMEQLDSSKSLRSVYEQHLGIDLFQQLIACWKHMMSMDFPPNVAVQLGLTYPSAHLLFQAASLFFGRLKEVGSKTRSVIMRSYLNKMEEHEFGPQLTRMVSAIYFARTVTQLGR